MPTTPEDHVPDPPGSVIRIVHEDQGLARGDTMLFVTVDGPADLGRVLRTLWDQGYEVTVLRQLGRP